MERAGMKGVGRPVEYLMRHEAPWLLLEAQAVEEYGEVVIVVEEGEGDPPLQAAVGADVVYVEGQVAALVCGSMSMTSGRWGNGERKKERKS